MDTITANGRHMYLSNLHELVNRYPGQLLSICPGAGLKLRQ